MFLSASDIAFVFNSNEERKNFLCEHEVVGIYNDSTICFDKRTGEFWSVLKTKRYKVSRAEVNKMGLTAANYKKQK